MLFPLTWSTLVQRNWATLGFTFALVVSVVHSNCPRDVSKRANECFTSYSAQFNNMQHSSEKLCCGIDVETLRAFCSSYVQAKVCVSSLRRNCPEERHQVDKVLLKLDEAQAGLHELCTNDSIIESYAMYQSCFWNVKHRSDRCFKEHFRHTRHHSIRFLSDVSATGRGDFCSNMRAVVKCVERSVKGGCGARAADLAAILVKPMIRRSGQCEYVIYPQKTTTQPSNLNPAYISDESRSKHRQDGVNPKGGATNSKRHPYDRGSPGGGASSGPFLICSYLSVLLCFYQLLNWTCLS